MGGDKRRYPKPRYGSEDRRRLVARVKAVSPELIEDNAHLIDSSDDVSEMIDVCLQLTFELQVASAD